MIYLYLQGCKFSYIFLIYHLIMKYKHNIALYVCLLSSFSKIITNVRSVLITISFKLKNVEDLGGLVSLMGEAWDWVCQRPRHTVVQEGDVEADLIHRWLWRHLAPLILSPAPSRSPARPLLGLLGDITDLVQPPTVRVHLLPQPPRVTVSHQRLQALYVGDGRPQGGYLQELLVSDGIISLYKREFVIASLVRSLYKQEPALQHFVTSHLGVLVP